MGAAETVHQLAVTDATVECSDRGTGDPVVSEYAGVYADWLLPVAAHPEFEALKLIRVRGAGCAGGSPAVSQMRIEDHAAHLAAGGRTVIRHGGHHRRPFDQVDTRRGGV